jgi:hypothetical protein
MFLRTLVSSNLVLDLLYFSQPFIVEYDASRVRDKGNIDAK